LERDEAIEIAEEERSRRAVFSDHQPYAVRVGFSTESETLVSSPERPNGLVHDDCIGRPGRTP
jgi:hypothetical protein